MPDAINRLEALRAKAERGEWCVELSHAAVNALPALLAFARALKYIATRLSEDVKADWSGNPNGSSFECEFCGHKFVIGDQFRWIYANGNSPSAGNFMVCAQCDGTNEDLIRIRQEAIKIVDRFHEHHLPMGPATIAVTLRQRLEAAERERDDYARCSKENADAWIREKSDCAARLHERSAEISAVEEERDSLRAELAAVRAEFESFRQNCAHASKLDVEAAVEPVRDENARLREALAFIETRAFTISKMVSSPYRGKWVCGDTSKTWPSCVLGSGDSPLEAIESASAALAASEAGRG